MSPAQRRALVTILGLVVAGHGVRTWLVRPGEAPGSVALLTPAGATALTRQQIAASQAGKPLAKGERIDLNRASAADLARLPRVGPGLARRIVADRAEKGPFHTLADLDRVPGVGAALLREVRDWVLQGEGMARAAGGGPAGSSGSGPVAPSPAPSQRGATAASPAPQDINTASEADLLRLPGIGPTKARAIVAYRQARGPFASVGDLVKVPGIGPATVAGLTGLVRVQ